MIREDKRKEWIALVNEPQNFFKHADSDPAAEIQFDPDLTEFLLFDCAFSVRHLTGGLPVEFFAFAIWFYRKYPDILLDCELKELLGSDQAKRIDIDDFEAIRKAIDQFKQK